MNIYSAGQYVTVTSKVAETASVIAFIVSVPRKVVAARFSFANIHIYINTDEVFSSSAPLDTDTQQPISRWLIASVSVLLRNCSGDT